MRNSLSVKQLSNYIKNVFEDELVLQNISVTGEVFETSLSKYTFITLKEDDVTINCVGFKKNILPNVGEKITLTGSVGYNPKNAKISFIFNEIEVIGNGLYQAEYLKLKEKLRNAGYFNKKQVLPSFITKVCMITSNKGSVIHDFLSAIENGHSYIDVKVYSCTVQGRDAETEILNQIKKADAENFDILVLARGGGSASDLECFNRETLAVAVGSAKTPVISAIGHETDFSLCDLCASLRAGTPSFAAKLITENNLKTINRLYTLNNRLQDAVENKIRYLSSKLSERVSDMAFEASCALNRAYGRLSFLNDSIYSNVNDKIVGYDYAIKNHVDHMITLLEKIVNIKEGLFVKNCVKMDYVNPVKILSQGYAAIYKGNERVLSAKNIDKKDELKIIVSDGSICAEVISTEESI